MEGGYVGIFISGDGLKSLGATVLRYMERKSSVLVLMSFFLPAKEKEKKPWGVHVEIIPVS